MTAEQALEQAAERLMRAAEHEARLLSAPIDALSKIPKPGEWSRLQHADHLLKVHRLCTHGLAERLGALPLAESGQPSRQGRYVTLLLGAMRPGRRMPTGGPFSPELTPGEGVVERLAASRQEILLWVEQARGRDLNLRVFRSPAPLVRMGFAEWLTLHARHAEHHAEVMQLFAPAGPG